MSTKQWARTQQPNTPETVIDIVLELDQLASRALQSLHDRGADPTTAADTTMRITSEVYVARSIFMIAAALEKIAITLSEHPGMVVKDGLKGPAESPSP
jgi:hypothetical protein